MSRNKLQDVRVLIVDDDPDIRTSVDVAFRAEGAVTELVEDGNAAVHACQTNPPRLVILDMMLPKRSGFLVLEKIKQVDPVPIVIMMTANEGRRHMVYAETLGVDAYLQKPVPLQRLIEKAVALLDAAESAAETP